MIKFIKNRKVNVFLGGTGSMSYWRKELIPKLECGYIDPTKKNENSHFLQLHYNSSLANLILYVITPLTQNIDDISKLFIEASISSIPSLFIIVDIDLGISWTQAQIDEFLSLGDICFNEKKYSKIKMNRIANIAEFQLVADFLNRTDENVIDLERKEGVV